MFFVIVLSDTKPQIWKGSWKASQVSISSHEPEFHILPQRPRFQVYFTRKDSRKTCSSCVFTHNFTNDKCSHTHTQSQVGFWLSSCEQLTCGLIAVYKWNLSQYLNENTTVWSVKEKQETWNGLNCKLNSMALLRTL